jgi:hypothetical protein
MNVYNVYTHPQGVPQAVKVGFSWPCFFFGWVWAAVAGRWSLFWMMLGGWLVSIFSYVVVCEELIEGHGAGDHVWGLMGVLLLIGNVATGAGIALYVNQMHYRSLENKGYTYKGNMMGESEAHALIAALGPRTTQASQM